MKINAEGLALIKAFEGLETEAYVDPVGIWTIGYGHIQGVQPGDRLTEQEAEALLLKDLIEYERGVERIVKVSINENEFSALVSFAFNVGINALKSSTALKRLNAGDRLGAAEALTWWNKGRVNGKLVELPGLTRRRAAEKALFLKPVFGAIPKPAPSVEESGRVTPDGESPNRREKLTESRTIKGAGTAGAAGAAAVAGATAEMTSEKAGTTEHTAETSTDTGTAAPETHTETTAPEETATTEETAAPETAAEETTTVETAAEDTTPKTPAQTEAVTEQPATTTVEKVGNFFDKYPEIYIILGVIVLFALLYIVFARIDDWRQGRR